MSVTLVQIPLFFPGPETPGTAQNQVSSFYERPKSDVLLEDDILFPTDIAEGPVHASESFRASDFRAVASSHQLFVQDVYFHVVLVIMLRWVDAERCCRYELFRESGDTQPKRDIRGYIALVNDTGLPVPL